jgi:hypothetical protein
MASGAWIGINEAIAALAEMDKRVDVATMTTTIQVAAEVEARAKKNFVGSHRPGQPHVTNGPPDRPNIVTGTLRRSIHFTPTAKLAGGYTTTVGPSTVYGRRVELGFVGTDSLGRTYNQPAFEYFGPAVKEVRVRAQEIATTNWAAAITR